MEEDQVAQVEEVVAFTYADDDRDLPPREVHGSLQKHYVDSLDYMQYLVDGVIVDPNTVVHPGRVKS